MEPETPEPDDPVGDDKDWTWTLTRVCPDCGLAAGEVEPATIADRAFVAGEEWAVILRSGPAVSSRPEPRVWSPLEYGCHVRDVYLLFDERLRRMLEEETPTFANWDQDETAIASRYDLADPDEVAEQLEGAVQTFTARLGSVHGAQWERRGVRSNGSEFTVATLSQYFLHDVVHHLWDVTGQQDAASSLQLAD